jgi:three-Cys-motif partner protein
MQGTLFELPKPVLVAPKAKPLQHPYWSDNKAALIERYLRYFVYITKHGTYIDGFAGPQAPRKTKAWSAKAVIESEPRRLRHFYLFDLKPAQTQRLENLINGQRPRDKSRGEPKRTFEVRQGDFNVRIHELLEARVIKETEATFCLLDQRTFECHWSTVEALARYKKVGNKIELFYFLPIAWLDRALAAIRYEEKLVRWWGRSDWRVLRNMSVQERALAFCQRLKNELGYRYTMPFPIYERRFGGRIMYYMIHATDHAEANVLMARAYNHGTDGYAGEQERLALDVPLSLRPNRLLWPI